VGGRLLNATLGDGAQVDLGGQWVGPDHARVRALAREMEVGLFAQFGEGRNLLDVAGTRRRYRGTIPRLGLGVLWDVFVALERLYGGSDPGGRTSRGRGERRSQLRSSPDDPGSPANALRASVEPSAVRSK
jgi:monoamine oxidase